MHPREALPASWGEARLFWATIAYHRFWCWFDGPTRAVVRDGGLKPLTLRRINRAYSVDRTIVFKEAAETADEAPRRQRCFEALCEELSALIWPPDMLGRSDACELVASRIKTRCDLEKLPVSAVTKWMWFLRSEGWTPFDTFARRGLGSPASGDTATCMKTFYRTLADRGFPGLAIRMNGVIAPTPLRGLPAERILDTLLVDCGRRHDPTATQAEDDLPGHRAYLDLLPAPTSAALRALAADLERHFHDDAARLCGNKKGRH
jgi:hypothetical protein